MTDYDADASFEALPRTDDELRELAEVTGTWVRRMADDLATATTVQYDDDGEVVGVRFTPGALRDLHRAVASLSHDGARYMLVAAITNLAAFRAQGGDDG